MGQAGQPVLTGQLVRLEPLTLVVLEDYLGALAESEVNRLAGGKRSAGMANGTTSCSWPS